MMPRHLKTWTALSIACAASLLLGACGDNSADQNKAASGEILPRSVTDDMPPYDTVRSQSPLAPDAATVPGSGAATPSADSTEAAAAAEEAAEEASAIEAAPATVPE